MSATGVHIIDPYKMIFKTDVLCCTLTFPHCSVVISTENTSNVQSFTVNFDVSIGMKHFQEGCKTSDNKKKDSC